MSYEFQILEKAKARVASIRANWGLPASTPLIDRLISAASQVRSRVAGLRGAAAPPAPAPAAAPAATQYGYEVQAQPLEEYGIEAR